MFTGIAGIAGFTGTATGGGAPTFVPTDLGAKLLAWYDPSDLTTLDRAAATPVTSDGDQVQQMRDKSGNGHDITQGTVGSRALWKIDGSGNKYMLFDGTDDFYNLAWFSGHALPWDRFSALQQITWVLGDYVWGSTTSTGRPGAIQQGPATTPSLRQFDGTTTNTLTVAPPLGTNFVLTEHHIANASKLAYDNNAYQGPTDCGNTVPGQMILGAGGPTGLLASNIRFYGCVFTDGTLTAGEIAQLRTYFGNKCGLTL